MKIEWKSNHRSKIWSVLLPVPINTVPPAWRRWSHPKCPPNFLTNSRSLTICFWTCASFSSSVMMLWWEWLPIIFWLSGQAIFQCDCCFIVSSRCHWSTVSWIIHSVVLSNLICFDRARLASLCKNDLLELIRSSLHRWLLSLHASPASHGILNLWEIGQEWQKSVVLIFRHLFHALNDLW